MSVIKFMSFIVVYINYSVTLGVIKKSFTSRGICFLQLLVTWLTNQSLYVSEWFSTIVYDYGLRIETFTEFRLQGSVPYT